MILGETITKNNAKIDIIVKLAYPRPYYILGKDNPAIGTKWETVGKIYAISNVFTYVYWDNGCSNTYNYGTLREVISEDNNSSLGVIISIWD